jgi:hypothetical protein
MPDAKCDKCGETLGTICKGDKELTNFANLVDKRSQKMLGQIIKIAPGIHHNEIDTDSECDGFLWYRPFDSTPPNVSWGL